MIVPGWAHIYCGRQLRGKVFLGFYLVLLTGGLLFAGTTLGALLLGLAVSCHVSSILDISLLNVHGVVPRIVRSLVTFACVVMLIYVPLGWLVGQAVTPRRIAMTAPPLQAGDVVLIHPNAYRFSSPRAGDIVLYDIPRTTVSGNTNMGMQAQVFITGAHIDRVLAVGGQEVESRDGALYVDGEPSPFRPLNPRWTTSQMHRQVPHGQLLIIPSTNPYVAAGNVHDVCLVQEERLSGRVLLRTQPLSRFGSIE